MKNARSVDKSGLSSLPLKATTAMYAPPGASSSVPSGAVLPIGMNDWVVAACL